ncbi:MAG TPA: hypothetical protein VNB90_02535 [Cytophagaceae bacterium]|jgi:hypothetical protein|nr:hypothetical protein [Cytophagaceae bacterium]
MKIYKLLIAGVCALLFFACKKEDNPSADELGYSYYPINVGDYSTFDVVDSSFQGVGNTIVTKYQIKEELHDPITVSEETRYEIYRYYKNDGNDWNDYPDSVWTVFNPGNRILRVQNNVRFVKLVFPFQVNKQWDGNISDTINDPLNYYTMTEVRRPFKYDNTNYPQTVSVVEQKDSSGVSSNYTVAVYAKDYGLVYYEVRNYRYQQINGTLVPIVEFGEHTIMKLTAHGRYQ